MNYLRHIKRLADYKFGLVSYFAQFGVIGATGTVLNMILLSVFLANGMRQDLSIALSIFIPMNTNFFLNKWLTFRNFNQGFWMTQYVTFLLSCSLGAVLNYLTTYSLLQTFAWARSFPPIPAGLGVLVGLIFNFSLSRYWVFRDKEV